MLSDGRDIFGKGVRMDALARTLQGGDLMKPSTYYMGNGHSKYGIWNKNKKQFQFGIREDTPMLAEARLFQKIGEDAKKWKFEVREVTE